MKTPYVEVETQTAMGTDGRKRTRYQVQWRMVVHDEGLRERLPGEGTPYQLADLLFDERRMADAAAARLQQLLISGRIDPEDGHAVAAVVGSW